MRSKHEPSEEERKLFRESVKGAKPLRAKKKAPTKKTKPLPRARFADMEKRAVLEESLRLDLDDGAFSGEDLWYAKPGVQLALMRKLRRGQFSARAELDLHGHDLPEVPEQVWGMTWLTELHLYYNKLTTLPEAIGQLTELTWLGLENNELRSLPDSIGALRKLTRLDLQDNQLTALPDTMAGLSELKDLYLMGNQLRSLPAWLADLPKLTTVYAARNPLADVPPAVTERFGIVPG